MPKEPILSREMLYTRLRDGSFRDLDWNLVNTSIGGMVEPRTLNVVTSPIVQADPYDMSFTRRTEFNVDQMFELLGTAGPQLPADYNTQ